MPLCAEAFFIKANWMALVHMTYCYFSIHFFTHCAPAISIFDVYRHISGTMANPEFTRSGSSLALLSRHRFTPNMFLKLTRSRRWDTQWPPSWPNGIWTITDALASHLLSELVTRNKWRDIVNATHQSSFGFDERSVLAVHFVVKSTGIAEVVSGAIATPKGCAGRATIHALPAFWRRRTKQTDISRQGKRVIQSTSTSTTGTLLPLRICATKKDACSPEILY